MPPSSGHRGSDPAGPEADPATVDSGTGTGEWPDSVIVDGRRRRVDLAADRSLLEVLRDDLDVTGPKPGCGEGACAACTVLIDGEPAKACVTPVHDAVGRPVSTIAGLTREGGLHPVQEAFLAEGAFQCGYCTPGMVLATVALLDRNPSPSRDDIRAALEGHICRCGAYARIERAAMRAASASHEGDRSRAAAEPDGPRPVRFDDFRPARPWDRVEPDRREYFELLGDGLVVVLPPPEGGFGGHWMPRLGGAWLHVGEGGTVTAFSGKIDVGQDNRTAFALIVAEELRTAPAAVSIAMGDTDLCPSDPGTFGSRSLPDAGEALAACAAAAREALVALACDRLGASRQQLEAAGGEIRGPDGATGYGDLVRGMRRVVIATGQEPRIPPQLRRLLGRPARRAAARPLLTGEQRFPSDLKLPGMLHALMLRPPAYGAKLESVEIGGACAIGGVTALREGDLVVVAAPTRATAERALAAIEARWSAPSQPREAELESHLRGHPVETFGWERAFSHEQGDVERALTAAEVSLQRTYTTSYLAHASLETRVALAEWRQGRLTVWTGTQQPFAVRGELARALDVSEDVVRVIVPDTGGGFGSKHVEAEAIAAAQIARAAGAPVRLALSREEEFRFTFMRPASVIDVRSAAGPDGSIAAWDFLDVNAGSAAIAPPYDIESVRIAFQPADSPLPQGPYRALAATANNFARESHVDELADALGIDPLQLRLRNVDDERLAEVLSAVARRSGWESAREQARPGLGIGIAAGMEKGGRVATCAEVRVAGDRLEVLRIVTAYDCGAIVNPATLENQIEGALAMGLGGALFEAVHFGGGRIGNASMSGYRVPRIADVPPIEVIAIDRPEIPSAGAGETPMIALAPALANAIFAASGRRIRSLPLLRDGRLPVDRRAAR